MSGELTLYVWNYNHSSWSMRAGIALRQTGVKFRELSARQSPDALTAVKAATPTGLLPVLQHGEQVIWDSLAIGEYLAEQFPEAGLWPNDKAPRSTRIRFTRSSVELETDDAHTCRSACGSSTERAADDDSAQIFTNVRRAQAER
ncbi:MAG TPA: glutathione S-transferase N-terminal domain-containing protein [Polyangiaceae bacterium]|jgi:glutathione S-transferase|nr:glutathione S-transferase N-terminal domain-containing protein [Polyangiaceae bacterium]